jgi:tetratricopeptide (TPR) repeat protein
MASGAPDGAPDAGAVAAPDAPDAPTAAAAPHVAATPALRADVERLASQLEYLGRRYLTRDWKPALAAARDARGEVEAVFAQLAALTEPAELLAVAAPLGATGLRWVFDLVQFINCHAFAATARKLVAAAESCGAAETVRASCDFLAGFTLHYECQLQRAQALLERAVEVRSRVLGAASREALDAQHALGVVLYWSGKSAEAEPLLKAAYDGRKRLLGGGDAETLLSLLWLANSLTEQDGKAAAAVALLGVALRGLEAALGPDHPHTLVTVFQLGINCRDPAAAEVLFRRALEGYASGLGEGDDCTKLSREVLAHCLMQQEGRHAEAEPLLRRVVEDLARSHGATHAYTLRVQASLAECIAQQGRHAEALDLTQGTMNLA